jgi:hypothetical protein
MGLREQYFPNGSFIAHLNITNGTSTICQKRKRVLNLSRGGYFMMCIGGAND